MGPARTMDEVTPLQQRIAKAYGNAAEGKAPAGLTAAQRAERTELRKQMLKSMRDAGEVLGLKRSAFTMKDLGDTFDAIDAAARAYTSPNIKTALEDANGRNGLGQVLSIAGLNTTKRIELDLVEPEPPALDPNDLYGIIPQDDEPLPRSSEQRSLMGLMGTAQAERADRQAVGPGYQPRSAGRR